MANHRLIPVPTLESRPFWEGAAQGRLMLPRCASCGLLHYPPPPRCPDCLHAQMTWETVSGIGKLHAWTTVFADVLPGVAPPFVVAEVELDDQAGLFVVSCIIGSGRERLTQGAPVRVNFELSTNAQMAYPVFELLDNAPDAA